MIRIEDLQAILDLNNVYNSIILEWNKDTQDRYYQYLYNEMQRLTPEVKKELRALEVSIDQIPEYFILLERIEQIKKLFQDTHKHQFIFHHVNNLKEYLDLTIQAKQEINPEPVKPKKDNPNKLTFKDLFKDPENAKKVKEILEKNHYTLNGKWAANKDLYTHQTENKTELLVAYYTLKNKGILKQGKATPQAKIFYNEFGLKVGEYISDRSLRNEPPPYQQKIFEKLFYSIK